MILDLQEAGWNIDAILNMQPETLIKLLQSKNKKQENKMTMEAFIKGNR